MYSREQIDQVRSAVDIVDVIREYVPSLKAAGRSVRGLCPFHSERTPSFHVQPEKGIFKCFGCGEGGDAIGFLTKIEQIGFSEALEKLADKAGVRLVRQDKVQRTEPEGIKEKLHRVLAAASRMYEEALWDERLGSAGRSYLETRKITEDTAQAFHLGLASSAGGGVFEALVKKGFSIELCQQAGLVSRSSAGRFYDPMFARLIFPIFDSFGHVIGFGGRILPNSKPTLLGTEGEKADEGPKYLNSPETPVFSKGKSLYGIREAKPAIMSLRSVIVLEGYMDVIGVHQGGVKNAVATLGTAFTRDHAKALKRYGIETVFAFFDPDEAGQKAAMRSLEPILQEEIFPRVVQVEGKADPDEIILEKGKEFFDSLIQTAPDFVDYTLKQWTASEMTLQQKAEAARQLVALIGQSPNDILKSEWIGRLAQKIGLKRESLEQELKRRRSSSWEETPSVEKKAPIVVKKGQISSAEEEFLQLLMTSSDLWSGLDFSAGEFLEERHKTLFSLLESQMREKGRISVPALCEDIPADHKEWLVQLSMEEREFSDPSDRLTQLMRDIRLKRTREKLGRLKDRVAGGQASVDEQTEYMDLLKKVKGSTPSAV